MTTISGELARALAPFDTDTLVHLASRGAVRRASKDVATFEDDDTFAVADETVRFDAAIIAKKGLEAGTSCTCPASGACRHVLAAVLATQEAAPPTTSDAEPATESDAWDDITTLDDDALRQFAGAQWWHAIELRTGEPSRANGRVNVVVHPAPDMRRAKAGEALATVMFLPGQGPSGVLKAALVKGTERHTKRLVAAAAMAVRRTALPGWMPEGTDPRINEKAPGLTATFLDDVARQIERAAADPSGASVTVEDELRLLATSGRAGRAPRLSAQLLGCCTALSRARARDVEGSAGAVLSSLAETYALVLALRANPTDKVLTGRLRREYQPAEPLEAFVLGAREWHVSSGARGLSIVLYDEANERFIEAGEGRAAGQDPGFQPRNAYASPWAAGQSVRRMMGLTVTCRSPRLDTPRPGQEPKLGPSSVPMPGAEHLTASRMREWPITHRLMGEARRNLASRLPIGLDAGAGRAHAILWPERLGRMVLDELAQVLRWRVEDDNGEDIQLVIPLRSEADRILARGMAQGLGKEVRAMPILVSARRDPEAVSGTDGLAIEPVALFLPGNDEEQSRSLLGSLRRFVETRSEVETPLVPLNLSLDGYRELERRLSLRALLGRVEDPYWDEGTDPHVEIARRALRLAEDAAGTHRLAISTDAIARLAEQAEGLGLVTLATALGAVSRDPAPANVLRTIYVARRTVLAASGA